MKKVLGTFVLACIMATSPAYAQLDFGIKAGVNLSGKINNVQGIIDNHTGWFAGPMVKFIFPVVGLGCEANVLYSNTGASINNEVFNKHSIEIPVYLRYELSLPVVKKIMKPFIAIGPQWGYAAGKNEFGTKDTNTSKEFLNTERYFKFKKDYFSLNVGLGFILFNHLQIHANYNIALGNTSEYLDSDNINIDGKSDTVKSKNNIWQLSLAYLF